MARDADPNAVASQAESSPLLDSYDLHRELERAGTNRETYTIPFASRWRPL